jgi:hypothetical protein
MGANPEFAGVDWVGPAAAGHGSFAHRYIVWHCTDNASSDAMGEANFALNRSDGIGTHFVADTSRMIQTLETFKAVGHVGSTVGNQRAVALEMCGVESNSTAHYKAITDVMMPAIRKVCAKWGIPARWLTNAQANDGVSKGWLTHDDARRFWGGTTHTDPGPNFDRGYAVTKFNAVTPPPPPAAVTPLGDAMILTVTGIPAGTTDAANIPAQEGGQFLATPHGLLNLTGSEFFSMSAAAQDSRMDVKWPRAVLYCNLLNPKPVAMTELAAAVAAAYPSDQITADIIRSAWTDDAGHTAFVALLNTPEVKASLADAAAVGSEYAQDH